MGRVICLLVCTLAPLLAEPVGAAFPNDRLLSHAEWVIPQTVAESSEAEWPPMEARIGLDRSWLSSAASGGESVALHRGEVPLLNPDGTGEAGNSVALATTLVMIAVFLREYFRNRRFCVEYQELKEHLAIARRKLEEVRAQALMRSHAEVLQGDSDLARRTRELDLLQKAFATRRKSRALVREYDDLQAHLALTNRDLEAARERWLEAARTGCGQVAGELAAREQEFETIRNAMAAHQAALPDAIRKADDLREHVALARLRLQRARAEWLKPAFAASEMDSEVARWEEIVNLLAARLEDHCRTHDCRAGLSPAKSFRRALA